MSTMDRRRPGQDEPDTDEENDDSIDPELRLRTVRTAASALAESAQTEARLERRKTKARKRLKFFRSKDKKKASPDGLDVSQAPGAATAPVGKRRNIYVNMPLPPDERDSRSDPIVRYVRNKVRTTSTSSFRVCTLCPSTVLIVLMSFRVHNRHFCTEESLRTIPSVCLHFAFFFLHSLVVCRFAATH